MIMQSGSRVATDNRPVWPAALGVPALTLLLLWSALAEQPLGWILPERVAVELHDRQYQVPSHHLSRLSETVPDWLSDAEADALRALEGEIEQASERLFDAARARIPDFADWYYSMGGLTTRGVSGVMSWALDDPDNYVAIALRERLFPAGAWDAEVASLERAVDRAYQQRLMTLENAWLQWLEQELTPYRVSGPLAAGDQEAVDVTARIRARMWDNLDAERAAIQMAGGGLGGVGAVLAVRSLSAASARAAAARAGTRLAARSTTVAATGACAGTGPLAIACGALVFTGATLGTEWAMLRADEALNREHLEAALEQSIGALQVEMMTAYSARLLHNLEADMTELNQTISGSLRPIDQLSR